MFANLGFYYVSVNYRGCDGYGKQFAAMKDSAGGVEDIMAARDYLIKNEPVDASKMILRSSSGGDVAVFELIKNKPGLWAGAILDHPGRAVEIDSSFPPMLVIASDQDRFYPAATNIFNRGKAADVDVRLLVYTNETHSIYKTGLQNDLYRKAGKFCLDLAK